MNLQEFAALRVGDKVENLSLGSSGVGEVVETADNGVRVVWGPRHDRETRFFYAAASTAWFSWSKVEPVTTQCTLCAKMESPGFYTGCMIKDGRLPDSEWNCDGEGHLTRKGGNNGAG